MIYWTAFTWEAFAALVGAIMTFGVGFFAARLAHRIGLKQVTIAERQADILASQVVLAETSLKADLFERRLATYEAAADFTIHLQEIDKDDAYTTRLDSFAFKLRESQFLFRPEVYAALLELWEMGNRLKTARAISIARHNEGLPRDKATGAMIDELMKWKLDRLNTLHEVFRPDLELGHHGLGIGTDDAAGLR